jgi:hypothetical protein
VVEHQEGVRMGKFRIKVAGIELEEADWRMFQRLRARFIEDTSVEILRMAIRVFYDTQFGREEASS